MNNRALLAIALMAALPAMAEAPNPLMAPPPRVVKAAATSPESQNLQTPLPPMSPMSPMAIRPPIEMPQLKESKRSFAVAGAPIDMQRDWFVSAIVGNSAILRQRSNPTASPGEMPPRSGGAPFPGGFPQQPQSGTTDAKPTTSSSNISIMITDGEDSYVMGLPVHARVQGDIVSLTAVQQGEKILVYQGGVEASQVVRAERKTTEKPDTAFASGTAPGQITGSAAATAALAQPQTQGPQVQR